MGRRVLVIDDSDTLRRSVRAALAESMPEVELGEAASSRAGLERAGAEPWDAVLLDLSLPDRSGVETLRELRRARPALPVVVMSLHGESEYGDVVRAAGAAGYVAKGSAAGALVSALRSALGGAPAPDAPPPSAAVPARTALARELHDGLGQTLVAAKLDLQLATTAVDSAEAHERAVRALGLVDEALAVVRELMRRFPDEVAP